jgi:hypothetical protein
MTPDISFFRALLSSTEGAQLTDTQIADCSLSLTKDHLLICAQSFEQAKELYKSSRKVLAVAARQSGFRRITIASPKDSNIKIYCRSFKCREYILSEATKHH